MVWGRRRVFVVEAVQSALAATRHGTSRWSSCTTPPRPPRCWTPLREVAGDRLALVPFTEPFNFSRKMNLGVLHASGDRIVLLNDDVEAITDCWLEQLLGPARRTRRGPDRRQALLQQ